MESSYKFPKRPGHNDLGYKILNVNNIAARSKAISLRINQILEKKKEKKILNLNLSEFPDLFPENLFENRELKILNLNNINLTDLINQRKIDTKKRFTTNDIDSLNINIRGFVSAAIENSSTFKFKRIGPVLIKKYLDIFTKLLPKKFFSVLKLRQIPKRQMEYIETLGIFDIVFIQTPLGINDELCAHITHSLFGSYLNNEGHGMIINTWKTFATDYCETVNTYLKANIIKHEKKLSKYIWGKGGIDYFLPYYRYRENILGQSYLPHTGIETSLYEFKRQFKTIDQIISCDLRPVIKNEINFKDIRITTTNIDNFRDAKISLIQDVLIENAKNKNMKHFVLENCSEIFQINLRNQNKKREEVFERLEKLKNAIFIPTIPSIKNKVENNFKDLKNWSYWCVALKEDVLDSEFVKEYLNSKVGKEQLLSMCRGSTIKHLDSTSVKGLLIINKPIEKQKENIKNNKQIDEAIKKLQSLKDMVSTDKIDFDPDLFFEKIPNLNLKKILAKEETATHEYKSSLRMNLETNLPDDKMIHSALKTLVAFLNTKGGNLIIGVADDKTLVGLAVDRFKNMDEWQRFLKDKIKKQIGADYLETYIHPSIHEIDGNDIAIIKTEPLPKSETAFLNDAIYVRLGPATAALNHKEMLEWNRKRSLKKN